MNIDHEYIEEHHVAQRYLMGMLSPADEQAFEEHFLTCSECLKRLRLAESMQRGLKAVAVEEMAARTVATVAATSWWRRIGRLGRGSLLAALLVALVVPLTRLHQRTVGLERDLQVAESRLVEQGESTTAEPASIVQLVSLSPVRSAGDTAAVNIHRDPQARYVVFLVDVMTEHSSYRVRLLSENGEVMWHSEAMAAGDGTLKISVRASFLVVGNQTIEVDGVLPDGSETLVARHILSVL
jgi:hypothetical protein